MYLRNLTSTFEGGKRSINFKDIERIAGGHSNVSYAIFNYTPNLINMRMIHVKLESRYDCFAHRMHIALGNFHLLQLFMLIRLRNIT